MGYQAGPKVYVNGALVKLSDAALDKLIELETTWPECDCTACTNIQTDDECEND